MERPIGVIDSGVGGLTVAKEIMKLLPKEPIIYLGDNARCPYGSRSVKEIQQFSMEIIDFLMLKNIKALVIACNTITAYMLDILQDKLSIPVVGVIQPGARMAKQQTKTNYVGIIATEATINSNSYPLHLKKLNPEIKTLSLACPLFVPYVEKGIFEGEEIDEVIRHSLIQLRDEQNIDTLVLGCTHFPLLDTAIQKVVGESIQLISPSIETARELKNRLAERDLLEVENRQPEHNFYTTGERATFESFVRKIIPDNVIEEKNINIEHLNLLSIK